MSEDLEDHRATVSALTDSAPRHTVGEDPEVQDILKKYTVLDESWSSLSLEVKGLFESAKPWRAQTDLFDELSCWLEELGGVVESDEVLIQQLDEAEGASLSDILVNFKVRGKLQWNL